MTREQLLAVIVVLGVLATSIQQFYALKTEVTVLHERFDYISGTWGEKH